MTLPLDAMAIIVAVFLYILLLLLLQGITFIASNTVQVFYIIRSLIIDPYIYSLIQNTGHMIRHACFSRAHHYESAWRNTPDERSGGLSIYVRQTNYRHRDIA